MFQVQQSIHRALRRAHQPKRRRAPHRHVVFIALPASQGWVLHGFCEIASIEAIEEASPDLEVLERAALKFRHIAFEDYENPIMLRVSKGGMFEEPFWSCLRWRNRSIARHHTCLTPCMKQS